MCVRACVSVCGGGGGGRGVFIQCKIKLKKENHHLAFGVKIYQCTNGYLV